MKQIIKRIMLRVGRGDDYILTAQDKWQIETLQQAGYLLEDIQKDIAKATRLQQTEIAEAMEDAGVKALDYDDKIYQSVGLSPTALEQSPELIRLMQRNYEATLGEWNNFTRTTAEEMQKVYINGLDRVYNLVSTGAMSYTQAIKEMIDYLILFGVFITYPSGHRDTLEAAILRALRTGISQATAEIQLARMDEFDIDLVLTSSHLGARPSHQEWQGRVFSRSGRNAKYPPFIESTGYGSVGGLCGANCRHSFSPCFEGMDNPFEQYDSEENLKQYEKEQRQRVLERRIRDTKRQVLGLKEAVGACESETLKKELDMDYQRKAALLAKQKAAYKEYCEENNLSPLSDRIKIARWDRQQAAAARGAAKRYENAHSGSVANSKIIVPKNKYGEEIQFDWKGKEEKHIEQQEVLIKLSNQYETRLQRVTTGAHQAAGAVDISGATMKLNNTDVSTAIHEFVHTLANTSADKYGLTHDQEFWKEIKRIRRAYMKDVGSDTRKWISSYEHSSKEVDEFVAEAFTQAKMTEYGLELPKNYGTDLTYSKKVLEIIDKYFKKKKK